MIKWNNLQELLDDFGEKTKLSEATGISTGNISDWFNPHKKAQPSADALIKIARYFDCSVDYLLDRTNVKRFVKNLSNVIQIPVFKQKAAAGMGKQVTDNSIEPPEIKWFYKDQVPDDAQYGIIIEGDSMEERFHDGQTIFVKLADDCNDSWFGIFCSVDDDLPKVVFKQKIMTGEYTYKLHSLNSKKYDDITDDKYRCIAVLVD